MVIDPDTIGKSADATKEVAKASGKAFDLLGGAGRFFERVFGDLVADGVGLLGDRLKFYRYERAVLLASKTESILKDRGVEVTRSLPPKVAIPLIEHASVEEDEDLHSRWANLLAHGMDPQQEKIERSFVSLLAELSARDAVLLDKIYEDGVEVTLVDARYEPHSVQHLVYGLNYKPLLEEAGAEMHNLENLHRLGLIAMGYVVKNCRIGGTPEEEGVFINNLNVHLSDNNFIFDPSLFSRQEIGVEDVHHYGLSLVAYSELGRRFCAAISDPS